MAKSKGCSISLDSMVLLTIVLVLLKAFGKIGCSWIWVFAPLWIPIAIVMAVSVILFCGWVWANTGRRW